uniref:Amidinotransferase n=1 Tax=Trichuris muris TaxID=70415 RepID=A0A5S6QS82_TRIMR
MKTILMCPPTYYDVTYEINPWMDKTKPVNKPLAWEQWTSLRRTIESCGATVKLIEPVNGLPDMVFTANAGLIYKNRVWLSQFMFPERQGEKRHFDAWFRQNGFDVYADDTIYEGAGDSLFLGKLLIGSHGFRSDEVVYSNIKTLMLNDEVEILSVGLIDSHFYHLDTTFAPLNPNVAIWYPKAHTEKTCKELKAHAELIDVSPEEANRFACNAVVIDEHVILPSGSPKVTKAIEARGFRVHSVDMSEFLKSGGACKCLCLPLN